MLVYLKKLKKLKIGTINIDWFKKSINTKAIIKQKIIEQEFDFLVVNENISDFTFDQNYFEYHSKPIPTINDYQHLDYGIYLKGETPIRTSIYSKHKSFQKLKTVDDFTSIAHKFNVAGTEIVIYGTIIGTWGIKHQDNIAKTELENFKNDCEILLSEHENIFIVGDFNTSFIYAEKRQLNTIKSRLKLLDFTANFKIHRATQEIENCIDHIFLSDNLFLSYDFKTATFLDDNVLKDNPHKGILLEINLNS